MWEPAVGGRRQEAGHLHIIGWSLRYLTDDGTLGLLLQELHDQLWMSCNSSKMGWTLPIGYPSKEGVLV